MSNPTGENVKKLTDTQELEVVAKYVGGVRMTDILAEYNIGTTTLYHILKRDHIPLRRPGRRPPANIDNKLDEIRQTVEAQSTDAAMVRYLLSRVEFLERENERLKAQLR